MALVSHIIGDCPGCGGKNTFGGVTVHGNHASRGCLRCQHWVRLPLVKLRKQIVYLDQSFFSRSFRENDAKFVSAAQRLQEVSLRQAIVIPYSSVHEEETYLWRGAGGKSNADLMHFIKSTTGNHEFEPAYSVQKDQLVKGFIRFISSEPIPTTLDPSDALPRDIHDWNNYIWLDVGSYLGDSEKVRSAKERSAHELLVLFEKWQATPPHFEEDVDHELRTGAAAYIRLYQEYVDLVANGNVIDAMLNSSVNSSIVETMLHHCFEKSVPMPQRVTKLQAYFASDHYKLAPYQWLSARMFAVLKEKVWQSPPQNKEKAAKRFRSFFHDVDHIATYAPYCDAFFMDNAMAK